MGKGANEYDATEPVEWDTMAIILNFKRRKSDG
jgi:DNA-directed RNA polymerase alpha subunit